MTFTGAYTIFAVATALAFSLAARGSYRDRDTMGFVAYCVLAGMHTLVACIFIAAALGMLGGGATGLGE